jgi:hypothetical protein
MSGHIDLIDNTTTPDGASLDDAIVREAHREFRKCQKRESEARQRWNDDEKFANGDAYNNFQWPDAIYQTRGNRPSLTVNETRQHNLHITNECKQNKATVKYRPVGDGATAQAAECWEGLYRHIANVSNAQMAQGMAIDFQVRAGLGFTVVESDFVDQKSFDQEIRIKSVPNPMGCYLCDSVELDGSDARGGFIFTDVPRGEAETKYPELTGRLSATNAVDDQGAGWIREDYIRKAKYYKVIEESDELLGNDDGVVVLKSQVPTKLLKQWEDEAEANSSKLKRRPVVTKSVKCYVIVGNTCVDETDIPGTSVPIIPWVGEVTVIDGRLDRKGHTRAMIGAQQMLNYNWSASVEFGALQSKTPYLAAAAAIEGYETYWSTANDENHAVLAWKHRDDEGKEIPQPTRQEPPATAPVYMDGIKVATEFMMTASGQYQAELGKPGNERSGRAINERVRQADRATYHFVDNQALAIRRQGQIVLEWAPVIYDTKRVLKILGEDDEESHVEIAPDQEKAHVLAGAVRMFNPGVGRYEVVSDVGPDFATQRQEAFNAIVQILTQAPELINKIGDLLFKVADFPLASEIADRLKPGLAPEAQQAIGQLQKQLQLAEKAGANSQRLLGEAMQALSEERLKVKNKDEDADIKAYDAGTRRLAVEKDMIQVDPAAMQALVHQTVGEALQQHLSPVLSQLKSMLGADTNPAGANGSGELPIKVPDPGVGAANVGQM